MATTRQTALWLDVNGETRLHGVTTSAGAAAVNTQMLAKSHADIIEAWEGPLFVNASPVTTTGSFQGIQDVAQLTFVTSAGNLITVNLPAPDSTIFLADEFTVDPTQIAALIAQVIADCVDAAGNAVTGYVAGIRQRF